MMLTSGCVRLAAQGKELILKQGEAALVTSGCDAGVEAIETAVMYRAAVPVHP